MRTTGIAGRIACIEAKLGQCTSALWQEKDPSLKELGQRDSSLKRLKSFVDGDDLDAIKHYHNKQVGAAAKSLFDSLNDPFGRKVEQQVLGELSDLAKDIQARRKSIDQKLSVRTKELEAKKAAQESRRSLIHLIHNSDDYKKYKGLQVSARAYQEELATLNQQLQEVVEEQQKIEPSPLLEPSEAISGTDATIAQLLLEAANAESVEQARQLQTKVNKLRKQINHLSDELRLNAQQQDESRLQLEESIAINLGHRSAK